MKNFVQLVEDADALIRNKSVWRKFIAGTPLENDIAVWMATFALKQNMEQPMQAILIKTYPRQPHTEVQIIAGNGKQANLPGRVTELNLWGSHSQMFMEINTFESPTAEEPVSTEVFPFLGFSIIAKEDPTVDPSPALGSLPEDNGLGVQDAETKH